MLICLFRYLISLNLKQNGESRADISESDDSIRYIRCWRGSLIRNVASQKCKFNASCRSQSVKSHLSDSYTYMQRIHALRLDFLQRNRTAGNANSFTSARIYVDKLSFIWLSFKKPTLSRRLHQNDTGALRRDYLRMFTLRIYIALPLRNYKLLLLVRLGML